MARNCFILERTALSIGLSDASPSSLIHGCSVKVQNTNTNSITIDFYEDEKLQKEIRIAAYQEPQRKLYAS